MSAQIKSLRGMHDVLPEQSEAWQYLEQIVREVMHSYCFKEMRTPILEQTSLFKRSIGEVTDIVEKEMYTFPDRKGESLSLRPENTAGCIRAAIEHNLLQQGVITRLWYQGPMFRYERPQKGRYRQFHQIGAEVYGVAGAEIEAELILLSAAIWTRLGLNNTMRLEINTLGTSTERQAYRDTLVAYFKQNQELLDTDSQRRLLSNPLRILDSKNPSMQALLDQAPQLINELGDDSRRHFENVQRLLRGLDIEVRVNPRLVRGLDYYSHTVFEWLTDELGAQGTCCAGGRYDSLTEQLGGKLTPAVGWAMGLERLLALLHSNNQQRQVGQCLDAYLLVGKGVDSLDALKLAESLRLTLPGLALICHTGGGSLKSQFKKADKSGALIALVFAEQELQDRTITVKFLRDERNQITIAQHKLAQMLMTTIQTQLN